MYYLHKIELSALSLNAILFFEDIGNHSLSEAVIYFNYPNNGINCLLIECQFTPKGQLLLQLLLLSRFSRVRLCATPIDGSPRGSPIPGILQARTLEWVAISFSNAWKWKVEVKSLSRVRLLVTPRTAAYQAPLSMRFSRQSTGVGCHCLLQRIWQITCWYGLRPTQLCLYTRA